MPQPIFAILLAGRIRPSSLAESLDVPVLSLPVGHSGTLLDAWVNVVSALPGVERIQAVVNTPSEVESMFAIGAAACLRPSQRSAVRVIAEPAAWRGAAGIVRDVAQDVDECALILVCEIKRLPPRSLMPLLESVQDRGDDVAGAVGVCGEDEPAGAYLFTQEAINSAAAIGYVDLKEQLIPSLRRAGRQVLAASLGSEVWRLNGLGIYVSCVGQSLCQQSGGASMFRISPRASIAPTVSIEGFCIVEDDAVIEDGAVLHNSVLLWHAHVGKRAVVSRSVVGPGAIVPSHGRILQRSLASAANDVAQPRLRPSAMHSSGSLV